MKYLILALSVIAYCMPNLHAQCTGSGSIDTGFSNSSTLDPDGDGDIVSGGSAFSLCSNEIARFESLLNISGCGSCQQEWTAVGITDVSNDLWAGGSCGNSDIVSDSDGGDDFAYFSVVDPDGTCDSGDEIIVFRLRIADNFNGNFSFAFLVSNDNLVGTDDPDGVVCCSGIANAGFEYEIQLKTGGSGSGVNIYDIDGVAGTDNCVGSCPNYSLGTNAQKATACGSQCTCRTGGGDPVYLTFFVLLSDIGATCGGINNLSFVPVTSTSGNPIIAKCSNFSDIGGIGKNTDLAIECPGCASTTYTGCNAAESEIACGFMCAASKNDFGTALPAQLLRFEGAAIEKGNQLTWTTGSEFNTQYFFIDRFDAPGQSAEVIGRIPASNFSDQEINYSFLDENPLEKGYYRLRTKDFDGKEEISHLIVVERNTSPFTLLSAHPNPVKNTFSITCENKRSGFATVTLFNHYGQVVLKSKHFLKAGENQLSLHLSAISNGSYFALLEGNHFSERIRLVKN